MISFKDLTLREGSQVPGMEITKQQGREVLGDLAQLEVDRVEVSFPRAHPRESWYRRADDLGLRTAALARAVPADVEAALAVDPDEIEVMINSSDVQLEHALGMSREEARDRLVSTVKLALDSDVPVGVTLMDAMRADANYLAETARAAVDAGASHVTLADTTGAAFPEIVAETVSAVVEAVGDEAAVGVHTHDDMGVATANAAVGVAAGATRVDATVAGIGERAGNAPIEEVAVLLAERGDGPAIDLDGLVPTCRRVCERLDVSIPPGKSVIGEHAYRHESGMHTAAMLREPRTYEPFDPSTYGGSRELLFGGDTGRGAVRALLREVDVEPTDERVSEIQAALTRAASEKGEPLDEAEARQIVTEKYI